MSSDFLKAGWCAAALAASVLWSATALAQSTVQPRAPGIESPDYVWNVVENEELRALRINANVARGANAYKVCHGCHRAGAVGTTDGTYPRLAGQHDTFLIKQLVDIRVGRCRVGRRDNAKMYPFANEHAINTGDIADLAAYLNAQRSPADNGRGDGRNLKHGQALYEKDCATCHGLRGEGKADMFYPRVGRQHYGYLLQESSNIRDGKRRNSNPKMVRAVQGYTPDDLAAVADYMSRLSGEDPQR
jgi:cytochrome c553